MEQEPAYRWVIVAAGGFIGCVAMGAMFSLPVLLNPITDSTGWSRAGVSAAMSLAFLAMAGTSMIWGALSDRYGAQMVVLAGAMLFSVSLWLVSLAPSLPLFQLSFGLLLGGLMPAFFAPLMATVTGWFTRQRALAVSLVSAGIGLAPVTMSPLTAKLVESYDWRMVLTLPAIIVAICTLPATALLRPAPAVLTQNAGLDPENEPDATMTLRQAVTSTPFLILVLTSFFCCATHSGPIFHTVSYAELCGLTTLAAVSIYSVEGIAGMGGRLGFGVMADRFGAKQVLSWGLLAQAVGVTGYYFASDLMSFYLVAVIVGFVYAGVMPLYNVLVRENFPMKMLGTIMGGVGMAGSLGMATGPVLGGWIFDQTGGYGAMYLTCAMFGLAAFMVAITFRPFPRVNTNSEKAQAVVT